jgi:hypothetical protein
MPWNSRYVAYATAHDKSPEDMLEADAERYPGGKMCGFTLWIQAKWEEWRGLFGPPPDPDWEWHPVLKSEHDHFDSWLAGVTPNA